MHGFVDNILFIDIGIDSNTDLVRWTSQYTNVFRMDIIASRASATEFYQHIEKSDARILFVKKNNVVFSICGDFTVQYQLLEAIIDSISSKFFDTYGEINVDLLAGMANMFDGFQHLIPDLIKNVANDIFWVKATCKTCGEPYKVCIKKRLIEETDKFPVSLVFLHRGHGLLLYIDANFKVRGAEIVKVSA